MTLVRARFEYSNDASTCQIEEGKMLLREELQPLRWLTEMSEQLQNTRPLICTLPSAL